MGRLSNKELKKRKNGSKVKSAKRSKFKLSNNDIAIYAPKNPPSGKPSAYLYGKEATDAKKTKKKSSKQKKKAAKTNNNLKNNKKSNFPARKRGKRLFIARFPVVNNKSKAVPWLKKRSWPEDGDKSDKQQMKIMNGAFSVSKKAMEWFNLELESFAAYVRLTPTEIDCRKYLIQQIQKSCKTLFGVDDSQCQVFGSFAAQSVCIFESDIDLAIWGVVAPDTAIDEINDVKGESKDNSSDNVLTANDPPTHSNRKKQEKVLKWKALIDDATKAIEGPDHQTQQQKEGEEKSTEIDEQNAESENDTETPLFVLDRIGDTTSTLDLNDVGSGSPDNDNKNDSDDGDADAGGDNDVKGNGDVSSQFDDADGDNDVNGNDDASGQFDDANSSQSDSSHNDDADKLENFWSRKNRGESFKADYGTKNNPVVLQDDDDSKDCSDSTYEKPRRRPRGQSLVSLSSSTTCSVEANLDESEMEVSFVVDASHTSARDSVGPSGATRTRVVNSLYKLTRPLRPFASQMHVRKRARVPIINMITHFGFECDIALGGHNGTDTSSYAALQLSRFKSFSILVVFLKILLKQQNLDKPFTGGLGSYALYVLVASHIEHHVALGGNDDPAEVLYAFFFRYGGVKHSNAKSLLPFRTLLSQDSFVETEDGGSTDLKSCFQIENCIIVFEACWQMLRGKLKGNTNHRFSVLQYMIDAVKLEHGRSQCKKHASKKLQQVTGGRMQPKGAFFSTPRTVSATSREEKKDSVGDLEARQLIQGYGESIEAFMPVEEIVSASKKRKATKSSKKKRQKSSS